MKKTITKIIILTLIGLSNVSNAQVQNWVWANGSGGSGSENDISTTTDVSGNVYVTGRYSSPTITFGTDTLTNVGGTDMFLVKYSASGNVIWAQRAGGTGNDYSSSIATDASGNVYVSGGYTSSTITLGATTLTNAGGTDIMIIKYDASGNVIWAKSEGSTGTEYSKSIAADASGNVCITGNFDSPSITIGATTLTYTGHPTIFIAKFDSSGNALWANRPVGGVIDNRGQDIATDVFGNVYVTGYFDHGGITFGTITVHDHGGLGVIFDMFVVKYDPSGNAVWAKAEGSSGDDRGYSITTDASGNVYATGDTNYPITIGATTLSHIGGRDMFIIKYDSSGNVLWAKGAGGSGDDYIQSSTTDASGNVYVTGYYNSPYIAFGGSTLIVNADGWGVTQDMFLVKYDSSGNVLWAMGMGGTSNDVGNSTAIDVSGDVYVAGNFNSPSIIFGATTLTNAGGSDMFIAKLGITTGIENNIFNNEVSVYPNPTTGLLFLSMNYNVTLTDFIGKIITKEQNTSAIDISKQPTGMYFLLLTDNKGRIVQRSKVIKE